MGFIYIYINLNRRIAKLIDHEESLVMIVEFVGKEFK